jgi:hypothetical protein
MIELGFYEVCLRVVYRSVQDFFCLHASHLSQDDFGILRRNMPQDLSANPLAAAKGAGIDGDRNLPINVTA